MPLNWIVPAKPGSDLPDSSDLSVTEGHHIDDPWFWISMVYFSLSLWFMFSFRQLIAHRMSLLWNSESDTQISTYVVVEERSSLGYTRYARQGFAEIRSSTMTRLSPAIRCSQPEIADDIQMNVPGDSVTIRIDDLSESGSNA